MNDLSDLMHAMRQAGDVRLKAYADAVEREHKELAAQLEQATIELTEGVYATGLTRLANVTRKLKGE